LELPSIAFHLRHLARSTDRLLSYAEGSPLSAEQLTALKAEQSGDEPLAALLAEVEVSFSKAADRVRVLATANLDTFRGVGRKQLPTSIGGRWCMWPITRNACGAGGNDGQGGKALR